MYNYLAKSISLNAYQCWCDLGHKARPDQTRPGQTRPGQPDQARPYLGLGVPDEGGEQAVGLAHDPGVVLGLTPLHQALQQLVVGSQLLRGLG